MLDHHAPDSTVVESNIMVPMRDGVNLATAVYLPSQGAGPFPVIMERTPYDKSGISRSEITPGQKSPLSRPDIARFFCAHGYAVVMQDCRGRHASQGNFVKYLNEANNGLDTMKWLASQGWCNGQTGTMGLSYGAHTQLALACMDPPGLACMFMDSGGFSSAYHSGIRHGGAFELKQATWAFRHALTSEVTSRDPARKLALEGQNIREWFRDMPWTPGHSPLCAAPEFEAYLFEQWQAGKFDDYWKQPGLYAEGYYSRIPDIPVSIVGSWYDPYALACTVNFANLAGRKAPVRLLMGPWTHGNRSVSYAGDVDFGPQAQFENSIAPNYLQYRLEWFDRFLMGVARSIPTQSGLDYFRMGGGSGAKNASGRLQHGGQWLHEESWPPASAVTRQFFFTAQGSLSETPEDGSEAAREYAHDPTRPVPTIGGAVTSGDPVMEGGAFDQRVDAETFCYSKDTSLGSLADRADVLVFETAPLLQDLELTGTVSAELWVSSDCPDTDFCIKLIDVYPPSKDYPEGFAMNITDGILRARYREGWDREIMMQPGQVYRLDIAAFPTSNLFKKGHRLRVDISSSNYPRFDINPNNGQAACTTSLARVAINRIYCSEKYPSSIKLTTIPGTNAAVSMSDKQA